MATLPSIHIRKMKYGYPEPPWTYSPKEVNEWINAVYGGHECRKCHVQREKEFLKNIEIQIDLNVEREIKKPSSMVEEIVEKFTGIKKVRENFEILPTAEIILRSLKKAGFRKASLEAGKEKIPMERIRKVLEEIAEFLKENDANSININAENEGKAEAKISRIHGMKRHSIEIKIDKIKEKNLQEMLIYIRKRLEGKERIV